jgi:hypothetical protein
MVVAEHFPKILNNTTLTTSDLAGEKRRSLKMLGICNYALRSYPPDISGTLQD